MRLHIGYCKGFGVSKEEIEATEESQGTNIVSILCYKLKVLLACTAYTRYDINRIIEYTQDLKNDRYVLDIGQSQDWLALQVALAPCLIGYGEIAKRLRADPKTKHEGNLYWNWIENYVADDYTEAVRVGSGE